MTLKRRSSGLAGPTVLVEGVAEPVSDDHVDEAEPAAFIVGVLDQLHLVHLLQHEARQFPLQFGVQDHLHGIDGVHVSKARGGPGG